MSYIIEVTSVKPAGVEWFSSADPVAFAALRQWQSGIKGVDTKTIFPDENTIIRTLTFESEEAYLASRQAHGDEPLAAAKRNYNDLHNIVVSTRVIE